MVMVERLGEEEKRAKVAGHVIADGDFHPSGISGKS